MVYKTIIYERKGNTGYIIFNRPGLHTALNKQMILELNDVLDDIAADNELGALILTGSGKSFYLVQI
jgi:enoyl-CoA hydratase/carnithine racemase